MATEPTTAVPQPALNPAPVAGTPPAAAPTPAAESKAKDVLNDMEPRRIFTNTADAITYLARCQTDFADFNSYPIAAPGLSTDESGAIVFDPAIYGEGINVMVAVLKERGDAPGKSTVRAIVIAPTPDFAAILANDAGRAWAQGIIEKELNHVAVRQLRKADSIGDVVESMPKTLDDYITSNRESGGLLAAYEELWRPIKSNLGKLSKPWRLANLSKKELRRALESSAYAAEYYPTLEEAKQGSLFAFALQGFIAQAKKSGLDPTIFERWAAGRDEKVLDLKDDSDDDEEIGLDDLMSAFDSAPEPAADGAATPPVEGQPVAGAPDNATGGESQAEGQEPSPSTTEGEAAPVTDETAEMTDEELEAATAPESAPVAAEGEQVETPAT